MTISPNKWELDTQAYLNTCNITAATPRKQLRDFAYGVDELGLWNSMVCWPLRSSQNIGTGSTAFSFGGLGTFKGALVAGPTYGADGINFVAASSTHITTELDVQNLRQFTAMAVANQTSQEGVGDAMMAAWGAVTTANYFILRKTATNVFNTFTRSGAASRQTNITGGVVNVGAFLMHGWGTQGAIMIPTMNGVAGGSIAFLPDETGPSTVSIGVLAPPNNSPYNGTIAAAIFFKDTELTTAQQLVVYDLYKSTLGTGLGLP